MILRIVLLSLISFSTFSSGYQIASGTIEHHSKNNCAVTFSSSEAIPECRIGLYRNFELNKVIHMFTLNFSSSSDQSRPPICSFNLVGMIPLLLGVTVRVVAQTDTGIVYIALPEIDGEIPINTKLNFTCNVPIN
jgi:hypothetical protein